MADTVKIPVSIRLVKDAIAAFLTTITGVDAVYTSATLQETELPCWHVETMPNVSIHRPVIGRWLREFRFALVYLIDYNLPNVQADYDEIAEMMDLEFIYIPYHFIDADGNQRQVLLHAVNRSWTIDRTKLTYYFDLDLHVTHDRKFIKMQVIEEYNETVVEVRE